jgi:hypothetical protein
VSGELRLANSGVAPLVTSLAALAETVPTGEFAVIGGLAVLARPRVELSQRSDRLDESSPHPRAVI